MQRVVSRSELKSDASSTKSSPKLDADERLKHSYPFDEIRPGEVQRGKLPSEEIDADGEEIDFRLFARRKPTAAADVTTAAQKIRLQSPSVDSTDAGFIQPKRNFDYYFTKLPSHVEKENLETVALTGAQVLSLSQIPWPGSQCPWKTLHLPSSSVHKSLRQPKLSLFHRLVDESLPRRRTRLGKKHRIRLRIKHAAHQKRHDEAKAAAETKAATERENRARRNREKKRKKRVRDKAKQADGADAGGTPAAEDDGE